MLTLSMILSRYITSHSVSHTHYVSYFPWNCVADSLEQCGKLCVSQGRTTGKKTMSTRADSHITRTASSKLLNAPSASYLLIQSVTNYTKGHKHSSRRKELIRQPVAHTTTPDPLRGTKTKIEFWRRSTRWQEKHKKTKPVRRNWRKQRKKPYL